MSFVVVTHGEFGAYLVEAAESIVGPQTRGVRSVSISQRVSVPEIQDRLRRALKDVSGPAGTVVLTDMPGGTPSNLAFPILKDLPKVEMVGGVNLYMLVSAFSHRAALPLERLVEKIVSDGQRSIRDIRQMLLARVR